MCFPYHSNVITLIKTVNIIKLCPLTTQFDDSLFVRHCWRRYSFLVLFLHRPITHVPVAGYDLWRARSVKAISLKKFPGQKISPLVRTYISWVLFLLSAKFESNPLNGMWGVAIMRLPSHCTEILSGHNSCKNLQTICIFLLCTPKPVLTDLQSLNLICWMVCEELWSHKIPIPLCRKC